MSKYTITFQELVEGGYYTEDEIKNTFKSYNLEDYLTSDEINVINQRGTWNKEKLANKIYNHYYMEEIGFETYARFDLEAKELMEELMEKYLPMVYSYSIEYDPLVNVDFTESFERQFANQDSASADGLVLNSDTPQGRVTKTDILAGNYASSTSGNETSSTGNSEGSENYTKRTKGNSGISATAQALLKQYRDNIRAVDTDIIKDLNILFMSLF
jgi:hypothetical protein